MRGCATLTALHPTCRSSKFGMMKWLQFQPGLKLIIMVQWSLEQLSARTVGRGRPVPVSPGDMRVPVLALLGLAACAAPPPRPARPDPPTLDIADSWVDPTGDTPARGKRPTRDRAAALHNPSAPVIAIRHATIMTAAGRTLEGGTIVLTGGAIT